MTIGIIISYIIATAIAAGALMVWRKYSHSIVEDIIFVIAVWLSAISFLGFMGRFQ